MTEDRFNSYLGKERMKWLKEEAKRQGLSGASELLRRIIDDYRRREGKK